MVYRKYRTVSQKGSKMGLKTWGSADNFLTGADKIKTKITREGTRLIKKSPWAQKIGVPKIL